MKQYRAVQVPAKEERILDKTICDLCGAEIANGYYDVDEVEVSHRHGVSYPEGGSGDETTVDMCGTCFEEKLVPWVKSQGGEPNVHHWDY